MKNESGQMNALPFFAEVRLIAQDVKFMNDIKLGGMVHILNERVRIVPARRPALSPRPNNQEKPTITTAITF